MKDLKIQTMIRVNNNFIDVYYSFKGLIFRTHDCVSIHVNNWKERKLDGFNMLSKKFGKGINSNDTLKNLLAFELKRKGFKLI